MNSVTVLLSTYNGQKYLAQQLDSLIAQQGVNLNVLIRDDGSTDATLDIVEHYVGRYDFIRYYRGENIGVVRSFFNLMVNAPVTDFYAFCDQDDVWEKNKLLAAVQLLNGKSPDTPLLYYSNLKVVDENLQFLRFSHNAPRVHKNKLSALTGGVATGCTCVFNNCALELIKSNVPVKCSMHDTWVYLVCKQFGETVYDINAYILYRQHGNNVCGTYKRACDIKGIVSKITKVLTKSDEPCYSDALALKLCFGNRLIPEVLSEIKCFEEYKYSFLKRLYLLFDNRLHAVDLLHDLIFRLKILMKSV